MRIAPLAEVKAKLSAYIEESETKGPIVITRNGRAVAVLVAPVSDDMSRIWYSHDRPVYKDFSTSHEGALRQAEAFPQRSSGKHCRAAETAKGTGTFAYC